MTVTQAGETYVGARTRGKQFDMMLWSSKQARTTRATVSSAKPALPCTKLWESAAKLEL